MCRDQPRTRGTRSFLFAALVAACSALLSFGSAPADARDAERENALKAGYLFNFMKFVEWPPFPAAEPFTVCFLGDSGVHDELSTVLPDKQLAGHKLVARRLARGDAASGCQVLYVDAGLARTGITPPPGARPAMLTVSDSAGFLSEGGIIELFAEGNRLRFRVSLENAKRANLRISSSLLQLASDVVKEN